MFRRLLLACLVLATSSPALAQRESSHDDPYGRELNYFRKPHGDSLSLLTADGRGVEIRQVLIHLGNQVLGVSTSDGFETRDENRVRLHAVPVLGGLFADRFSQDDLTRQKRIGTVYRHEDTLYVEIDRDQPLHPITRVVVLNQNNAYFLAGAPTRTRVEGDPYALRIGQAFIKNGEFLVLLIEPSVIQNNIFEKLF